ncbi:MAG: hypothetical protein ACREAB_00035 [Blastocatellia bacterium]
MSKKHLTLPRQILSRTVFLRLSLSLFLTMFVCMATAAAQPVDRAKLLEEIIALQDKIKNTTDPAELAALRDQLKGKETLFLAPAPEDFAAHSAFLQQPDTGLIRLLPRETFQDVLSLRGWGAYYSFTRLTHEYGYGSDIELRRGNFLVGFAGIDYGFLVSLGGGVGLETVTLDHPGVRYLANYVPPLTEPEAREEQRRTGAGFVENGFSYGSRVTATLNTTYVVRPVQYEISDDLVAFRFVRQDADGSVILLWKMLKWFPTPQERTASFLATVSAANFKRGPLAPESIVAAFGKEFSNVTAVATSTQLPTTLGGIQVQIFDSKGPGRFAPLFAVTPGQINFLVPAGVALGPINLIFSNTETRKSYYETMSVAAISPGLFTANADGQGVPAAVALRIRNGAQTYEPVARFDGAQNKFVPAPIDLGDGNDQVFLVLFGSGVRGRSSLDKVSVKIGGIDAQALYAGPQGLPGLDQMNVALPRSLAGLGEVDVILTVDGRIANTVRVNFK